jgi:hypothetical protein
METGESLDNDELTPLQEKLERIAGKLGKYAYFSAFIIFISQCIFLLLKIWIQPETDLL